MAQLKLTSSTIHVFSCQLFQVQCALAVQAQSRCIRANRLICSRSRMMYSPVKQSERALSLQTLQALSIINHPSIQYFYVLDDDLGNLHWTYSNKRKKNVSTARINFVNCNEGLARDKLLISSGNGNNTCYSSFLFRLFFWHH